MGKETGWMCSIRSSGMPWAALSATLSLFIVGCSSYRDLEEGSGTLGGGFIDSRIGDGVYRVVARSNFAPWTNFGAARKTFDRRAGELCRDGYEILTSEESHFEMIESPGAAAYIISEVEGFVRCQGSSVSAGDAKVLAESWEP